MSYEYLNLKDGDKWDAAAVKHLEDGIASSADVLNIKDSTGTSSLQQIQDSSYTTLNTNENNPHAVQIDPSLSADQVIGASGKFASSFGGTSSAQGKRSHAEGSSTIAKGSYSHAEGVNSVALGSASHAEGHTTVASSEGAHAEGGNTQALGVYSHAGGASTIAAGDASFAHGSGSKALGTHSTAFGNQTVANYNNQFCIGQFNKNKATNIFEVGYGIEEYSRINAFELTQEFGEGSTSINAYLPLVHTAAYLEELGDTEVVVGGALKNAFSQYSPIRGNKSANYLYQIGCTAENDSIALGNGTITKNAWAMAVNNGAQADGYGSFAMNTRTHAVGNNSLAQGYETYANGENSFSCGDSTQANGINALASGFHTIAKNAHSLVCGKFNANKDNTLFEVGNGSGDTTRSNAFEVGTKSTGEAFIRIGNVELTDTDLIKLKALIDNI